MRTIISILFLWLVLPTVLLAQKQNNIWYFGIGAGLDFNGSAPVALSGGQVGKVGLEYNEGCASIADRHTGALLFYTDGVRVWNRDHQVMLNGSLLAGDTSSTQSALIVPMPGDSMRYYIFTTDAGFRPGGRYDGPNDGLNYSIVDMRLEGGRGDVVTRNVHLLDSVTEKLCGVPKCDGYWVITQRWKQQNYCAFSVTATGISAPVVSQVGTVDTAVMHESIFPGAIGPGYLKPSTDGKRLASAIPARSLIELFDFDGATEHVSRPITLSPGFNAEPYGLCFSPDDSMLYVSEVVSYYPTGLPPQIRGLYQYDLRSNDAATIEASAVVIDKSQNLTMGAIALAPNGIIYCSAFNIQPWLAQVSLPNARGNLCQFKVQGIDLSPGRSFWGLPNMMALDSSLTLDVSAGSDKTICPGDTAQLAGSGGESYQWSPSTGLSCADCAHPLAFPPTTITYRLLATNSAGCSAVDSVIVRVSPLPAADAGRDTAICVGSSIALHASGGTRYIWSPTADLSCSDCADPIARPLTTMTYTVTVGNDAGCSSIDSVRVTVLDLPTADAGSDTSICFGQSVRLYASAGSAWQWTPAIGLDCIDCRNPIASPTVTTTYHLSLTNAAGCTGIDSVTVTVHPLPAIDAGADVVLCPGQSTTLYASGGVSYHWSPSDGLNCTDCSEPVADPKSTTTYNVIATSEQGCTAIDSVTVTIIDPTSADAGAARTICIGDSVKLQASDGATWTWSPADGLSCADCRSPIASPRATTTYTVTIAATGGCQASDTMTVTVLPLPIVEAGEDIAICSGSSAHFHASGAESYRWSPSDGLSCIDCADPIASPVATTTYTVTGTNAAGCSASDEVTVSMREEAVAHVHIDRDHRVLPGTTVLVPVVLDGAVSGVDTIELSLGYNSRILLLREVVMAAGLDGWRREIVRDSAGGIVVRFIAPATTNLVAGKLLGVNFAGYLADTASSELPLTMSFGAGGCVSVEASAGSIRLDSICGFSYRLIEVSPTSYTLEQNDPNPFNPTTEIAFTLGLDGPTRLEVLNAAGERVALLIDEYMQPGKYVAMWNGEAMPSGLYFYRLTSGAWSVTRRMVLVK